MVFPLYYFLLIYLLFILLWLVFSLVAIYHMIKFGFVSFTTFFATFVFIGVSVFLLAQSYNYISQVDWGTNMTIKEEMFGSKPLF